jgi:hypothetical protein
MIPREKNASVAMSIWEQIVTISLDSRISLGSGMFRRLSLDTVESPTGLGLLIQEPRIALLSFFDLHGSGV